MKEISIPPTTFKWCQDTLAAAGETLLKMTPLRVEASHRSFYRVHYRAHSDQQSSVLMESPPTLERNLQFATLARVFHKHGIPVPEIIAQDDTRGLFLLTDVGDLHLEDLYRTPARDTALAAAIDALPKLASVLDPAIEPYSRQRLQMELEIYNEWFVERLLGRTLDQAEFQKICLHLVNAADMQPKCCVHRDYHCRNLLFTDRHLGIVDFQDALHGPMLYDIASLLRDCYFEFSEADIDQWLHYYLDSMPELASYEFAKIKTWFDWIAIQRQLKAVGIFSRLHLRDHKSSHLINILPVMRRLLQLSRQYPEMSTLSMQLKSCIKWAEPVLYKLT